MGTTSWEVCTNAVAEREIETSISLIAFGVVLYDERARATDEKETHYFPPVVGVEALFKGGETRKRCVGILEAEFRLTDFFQHVLRANPDVFLLVDEQTKLIGKIEVSFVVRGRRDKNDLGIIVLDIVADRLVDFPFAVSKVVRLIDNDQTVSRQLL